MNHGDVKGEILVEENIHKKHNCLAVFFVFLWLVMNVGFMMIGIGIGQYLNDLLQGS